MLFVNEAGKGGIDWPHRQKAEPAFELNPGLIVSKVCTYKYSVEELGKLGVEDRSQEVRKERLCSLPFGLLVCDFEDFGFRPLLRSQQASPVQMGCPVDDTEMRLR